MAGSRPWSGGPTRAVLGAHAPGPGTVAARVGVAPPWAKGPVTIGRARDSFLGDHSGPGCPGLYSAPAAAQVPGMFLSRPRHYSFGRQSGGRTCASEPSG